jgi:hypothetical protein
MLVILDTQNSYEVVSEHRRLYLKSVTVEHLMLSNRDVLNLPDPRQL